MTTKHTPAPWRLFKAADAKPHLIFLRKEIGSIEIDHFGWIDPDKKISSEMLANAILIAAAPELLESNIELAKTVRELCTVLKIPMPEATLNRSDSVIAKATGAQA